MTYDVDQSEIVTEDPRAAAAIKKAIEKATRRFQSDRFGDLRRIIANRVADISQTGELDPARLCKKALESLGLHD
jgi:hypothetical protein